MAKLEWHLRAARLASDYRPLLCPPPPAPQIVKKSVFCFKRLLFHPSSRTQASRSHPGSDRSQLLSDWNNPAGPTVIAFPRSDGDTGVAVAQGLIIPRDHTVISVLVQEMVVYLEGSISQAGARDYDTRFSLASCSCNCLKTQCKDHRGKVHS